MVKILLLQNESEKEMCLPVVFGWETAGFSLSVFLAESGVPLVWKTDKPRDRIES
jgi:hypothetical protein